MKKIAVILAGCGYLDGAEISESVITLLQISNLGGKAECFAPNINQMHVVNHLTNEVSPNESRNVLQESARITRGNVKPLTELNPSNFDALIMPGGFGVAKNLSDIAIKGTDATVIDELKNIVLTFIDTKKPIGAICISPAIIAAIVQDKLSVKLTLGEDENNLITGFGSVHQNCKTADACFDENNKIYSCSAFMQEAPLHEVSEGISKVVTKVIEES